MGFAAMHLFLVGVFLVLIADSTARSTEKEEDPAEKVLIADPAEKVLIADPAGKVLIADPAEKVHTADAEEEVEIKLFVKRDAPLESQELPFVEGRTHRASEPINPNAGPNAEQGDSPQPLLGDAFETSQTIFQPEVDDADDSASDRQFVPEVREGGEAEERASLTGSETSERGYSAQYPYHQTTSDGQTGYQRTSQRRVVAYGGSGGSSYNPGYQTQSQTRLVAHGSGGSDTVSPYYRTQPQSYVGSDSQTQSQTRVVAYSGGGSDTSGSTTRYGSSTDTSGRYVDGGVSNTYSGGQNRGNRYPGRRYYDSAGHLVDQYGRHIDSSGRLIGSGRGQSSSTVPCCDGDTSQGFPTTYDPIVSQISNDPNCPSTNVRVRINGLTCRDALSQLGNFVCYNYERVSSECCEMCLQVKNPSQVGCEYGDRSYQCRNIQPFDCYVERNRQICCEKCREFREQRALTGNVVRNCEYGDLTPRCLNVRQRSHLCYLPENQRLCCDTCPRLGNDEEPDCRWGNQSPELCQPFDQNQQLRLNCYIQTVKEVCCATCKRLRSRMRDQIPGCEYGDSPVQFNTGTELLDCGEYIRQFGVGNCEDSEISSKCCYTCHRYRSAGRG